MREVRPLLYKSDLAHGDCDLSSTGQKQLQFALKTKASDFEVLKPHVVYCSPLKRTRRSNEVGGKLAQPKCSMDHSLCRDDFLNGGRVCWYSSCCLAMKLLQPCNANLSMEALSRNFRPRWPEIFRWNSYPLALSSAARYNSTSN